MFAPKPDAVREYALDVYRPSLWSYAGVFSLGAIIIALGASVMSNDHDQWRIGFGLIAFGGLTFLSAIIAVRKVSWNLTSDRLIERRGFVATRKREMELADIRSVEVTRRVLQRLVGLGDVTIASAASADYAIHLDNIANPDVAAETIRKARLKRLA
ncbi:MAG TPA: PH domain-containing protein [Candidatus Binataceae bacterium]|nr:PH domain-containing protein [Candidatus Binataceae bacterium]